MTTPAHQAAARIREALEAGPTPGPWITKKHANIPGVIAGGTVRRYVNGSGQDQLFMVCTVQEDNGGAAAQMANEMLVAACSPDSLRALLAERDELAKDAARWRAHQDSLQAVEAAKSDDSWKARAREVAAEEGKWAAVRFIRQHCGLGLREAADVYEHLMNAALTNKD